MGSKKEPGVKDSGISDLDLDFRRKWQQARGAELPDNDDFTPITNLGDLGPAISAIKRGQDKTALVVGQLDSVVREEIKPQLTEVRDGFIRLETEHRVSKRRLKNLEDDTKTLASTSPKPHDCYHEDDIVDLKEGQRGVLAEVVTVKTGLAAASTAQAGEKEATDKNIERIDGRSKTVTGIAVTVVLFVLGAAGAASAAFYTTQANVANQSAELSKVRDEVSKMRVSHVSASSKVQSAAESVEKVAKQVKTSNGHTDPLEALWCDLSPQERRRQERLRGSAKIPQRRCP